jgi:FAD/FMN-containing dehydrogenase
MKPSRPYESFGRFPKATPGDVKNAVWIDDVYRIATELRGESLPIGKMRTYGDSCLLDNGTYIDTTFLNRIISFDAENNILETEAGLTFKEALAFLVPRGKFMPVAPGTKYVTVAGAIANDVHGKNHHVKGTFGTNVISFELVRTDGEILNCSENENSDLFRASIGGLGLTGIITKAKFRVVDFPTPFIYQESIKYDNLNDFFELNTYSEANFPYTVAWVDCTKEGSNMGRGIYIRGRNAEKSKDNIPTKVPKESLKPFPFDYPFINETTVKLFNTAFYNKQINKFSADLVHFEPFYYPLDFVIDWNKAYGKKGFLQYQFVIPFGKEKEGFSEFFRIISNSKLSSFLTVMKTFGDIESPGMLSFPMKGVNLAIDVRNEGDRTLNMLAELDKLVAGYGGRIYPAKDSRMEGRLFKQFYPNWKDFTEFIDPKLISDFWKRITTT